jgi:glycosyltransferase involved in cell wall biosynthesis
VKSISIIICTYNPVEPIFSKCLSAILEASQLHMPLETLIIDNNSSQPLSQRAYIHSFVAIQPFAKIISEPKQGLTHARLRGISESKGDILLFIDDDNFIAKDLLHEVQNIARGHPHIGAYSGQVNLAFDAQPPQWTRKYWGLLVHRIFDTDTWGNRYFDDHIMPCGAGLCVLREVANYYLQLHQSGKRNLILDRNGKSFLSGGDNDLAMCAIDIGMGMGLFHSLYLDHYIPTNRFTLGYLTKLAHGIYFSSVLLRKIRNIPLEPIGRYGKITRSFRIALMNNKDRKVQSACISGLADGVKFISSIK